MVTVLRFRNSDLPSMNVLLRKHWSARSKEKEKMEWLVHEQTRNRHAGQVTIEYHRYAIRLMDWDNFSGSFKLLGDALVARGVIKDDKPGIVVEFMPKQSRVSKKEQEHIQITIKDKE